MVARQFFCHWAYGISCGRGKGFTRWSYHAACCCLISDSYIGILFKVGCIGCHHVQSVYLGRYIVQVMADCFPFCIGPFYEMVARQFFCHWTQGISCGRGKGFTCWSYYAACCCLIFDGYIGILFKVGCISVCYIQPVYLGRYIDQVPADFFSCAIGPFYKMVTRQFLCHWAWCLAAHGCKGFEGAADCPAFWCLILNGYIGILCKISRISGRYIQPIYPFRYILQVFTDFNVLFIGPIHKMVTW